MSSLDLAGRICIDESELSLSSSQAPAFLQTHHRRGGAAIHVAAAVIAQEPNVQTQLPAASSRRPHYRLRRRCRCRPCEIARGHRLLANAFSRAPRRAAPQSCGSADRDAGAPLPSWPATSRAREQGQRAVIMRGRSSTPNLTWRTRLAPNHCVPPVSARSVRLSSKCSPSSRQHQPAARELKVSRPTLHALIPSPSERQAFGDPDVS